MRPKLSAAACHPDNLIELVLRGILMQTYSFNVEFNENHQISQKTCFQVNLCFYYSQAQKSSYKQRKTKKNKKASENC